MAEEWYLMNTKHDTVSGFESDNFDYFGQDAFAEACESSFGDSVEICNFDLSERKPVRCIMEGNANDSRLQSILRRILLPVGTCQAGEYVCYKNRYWLIAGVVDDVKFYEKAVITLCNYKLQWIDKNGKLIERWASSANASQYNNGETKYEYTVIRSDQLMFDLPDDKDSMALRQGQRFVVDKECELLEKEIDESTEFDIGYDLITFELTRISNTIYNYQGSGIIHLLMSQDEQHKRDGYVKIGGKGCWLCDIDERLTMPKHKPMSCEIEYGDSAMVVCGIGETEFTGKFYGAEGEEIAEMPQWEIEGNSNPGIIMRENGLKLWIKADDRKLIGKTFTLKLSAKGKNEYGSAELKIAVAAAV